MAGEATGGEKQAAQAKVAVPLARCAWASGGDDLMRRYHDEEWGVPVHDERALFEFLILEGAQAGLSWSTILRRRDNYRVAFEGFNPERVASFTPARVETLLADTGIIRNRRKIEAAVANARAFLDVQREYGSFDAYIWRFAGGAPKVNARHSLAEVPATTPESDAMSKDLKRRGFAFVGSTICYAFMQAAGLVNDHTIECFRYAALSAR